MQTGSTLEVPTVDPTEQNLFITHQSRPAGFDRSVLAQAMARSPAVSGVGVAGLGGRALAEPPVASFARTGTAATVGAATARSGIGGGYRAPHGVGATAAAAPTAVRPPIHGLAPGEHTRCPWAGRAPSSGSSWGHSWSSFPGGDRLSQPSSRGRSAFASQWGEVSVAGAADSNSGATASASGEQPSRVARLPPAVKREEVSDNDDNDDVVPPPLPSVPPVRRAAQRATARISAALATHGMAHLSSDEDENGTSRYITAFSSDTSRRRRAPSSSSARNSRAGNNRDDDSSSAATTMTTNRTGRKRSSTEALKSEKPSSRKRAAVLKKEVDPPEAKAEDDVAYEEHSLKKAKADISCCICMEEPCPADLASIDGCNHFFCFGCIEKWADRENTCPLCKSRFHKIERVNKTPSGKGKGRGRRGVKSSKKVKNRDQRADLNQGNPLQGLFASMEASGAMPHSIAQLIFSGLSGGAVHGGLMAVRASGQGFVHRAPSIRRVQFSSQRTPAEVRPTASGAVPVGMARGPGGDGPASASAMLVHPEAWSRTVVNLNNPHGSASRVPPSSGRISDSAGFSDSDDGHESDSEGYGSFVQRVRDLSRERNAVLERYHFGTSDARGRATAPGDAASSLLRGQHPHMHPPARMVTRSYAVNLHDVDAGESPDNALEIEDSDDDDVEVVSGPGRSPQNVLEVVDLDDEE